VTFALLIAIGSVLAGAIASIVGFGIGSVLTPLLAVRVGTQLAVAAVSIPHLFATALRFWRLRAHVDRRVLVSFGITSAAGGLTGALLHSYASNRSLAIVFGVLLLFVGIGELTGFARRMRFGGHVAWIAGAVSGVFGGLVGNQGGVRSAALLGFDRASGRSCSSRLPAHSRAQCLAFRRCGAFPRRRFDASWPSSCCCSARTCCCGVERHLARSASSIPRCTSGAMMR
jgi:hypothetical protein